MGEIIPNNEFLGFSFGSLLELLEDCLSLEKDIQGGRRKTKDDEGVLRDLSKVIKLCMGEKTMLKSQMERMGLMAGEQGLITQNQRIAAAMEEDKRREAELNKMIQKALNQQKNQ